MEHLHRFTHRPQGMLIPKLRDTDRLDLMRVHWILVIEKEVRVGANLQATTKPRTGNVPLSHLHASMEQNEP